MLSPQDPGPTLVVARTILHQARRVLARLRFRLNIARWPRPARSIDFASGGLLEDYSRLSGEELKLPELLLVGVQEGGKRELTGPADRLFKIGQLGESLLSLLVQLDAESLLPHH